MSSGEGLCFAFILMLAGIFIYMHGLGQYRVKKIIEYTPTSKTVSIAPGITEISGVARAFGKAFVSPFDGKPCVYYQTLISKWEGKGKTRSCDLIRCLESETPFNIEDDTGRALVQFSLGESGVLDDQEGKDWTHVTSYSSHLLGVDREYSGFPKKDAGLMAFLRKNEPTLADYQDEVEIEETCIQDGDPIYVLGRACERTVNGKSTLVVEREDKKGLFCIADGNEKKAHESVSSGSKFMLAIGPVLFFVCFLAFFGSLKFNPFFLLVLSAPLVVLMYSYIAYIAIVEFFNSMIILRNGVLRASSNLDVLLKRRHDLIENLVKVVVASAKHERKIQEQIAKLRSSGMGSKQLMAIGERYPGLKASENYKGLSLELTRAENWLAGSRSYVADSILLYNTRISTFPYSLFAPFFKCAPIGYKVE